MNDDLQREAMLELVAAHALGVLPPAEQAHVLAFILADPQARAEFEELRSASNLIGLIADEPVDTARAAQMKERLLAALPHDARERNASPLKERSWVWATGLAAAAAVVVALVSAVQNLGLRSEMADEQQRMTALKTQVQAQHRAVERDDRMLADLTAADVKRMPIPFGAALMSGTHLYLALSSLPPPPRGKVYEAWMLPKGGKSMVASTIFIPSATGVTLVPVAYDADRLAAIAVSLEPEGGSRQPTTKPAFVLPLS